MRNWIDAALVTLGRIGMVMVFLVALYLVITISLGFITKLIFWAVIAVALFLFIRNVKKTFDANPGDRL